MQAGFHSRGCHHEHPVQQAGHRQGTGRAQAAEEEPLLSKRPALGCGPGSVVVLLELVHPHLRRALGVLNVCIGISLWKDVRMFLPEDMPNTAAGDDFQAPSTHPHPEGDFCKRSSFSTLSFCPRAV